MIEFYIKMESSPDSTNPSKRPCPSNDQGNSIATGYYADDECSDINANESTSIYKTEDHQNPNKTTDCRDLFRQTQSCYNVISSGIEGEEEMKHSPPCACNPYPKMQEILNLSTAEGAVNTKSPDINTCSLDSKCPTWVENTFTRKYGFHFTEDLVFAIDVVMLFRSLNGFIFEYIIYPTTNTEPESPCNEIIDKGLAFLWQTYSCVFTKQFDDAMTGKEINYKNFQYLLLKETNAWEKAPHEVFEFLMHFAKIAQWSACAEKKGVIKASYFTPLVICRAIYRQRIWEKITPTFWNELAEAAIVLTESFS